MTLELLYESLLITIQSPWGFLSDPHIELTVNSLGPSGATQSRLAPKLGQGRLRQFPGAQKKRSVKRWKKWGPKTGKSMGKWANQWKFDGQLENRWKLQRKIYGRIGKSMEKLENRWTINRKIALKSFLKLNNRRTINGKREKPMENRGKMCGSLEDRFRNLTYHT